MDKTKGQLPANRLRGYLVAKDGIVYRVIGMKRDEKVKLMDIKNHQNKFYVSTDDIQSDYTALTPDGRLLICTVGRDEKSKEAEDVITVLFKATDIKDKYPFLVCRQSINNIFDVMRDKTDSTALIDRQVVGCSVSRETIPANLEFDDLLIAGKVFQSLEIAIYKTDTLEDILNCVGNVTRTLDNVLYKTKCANDQFIKKYPFAPRYYGYVETYRDLLAVTNFMYDFYRAFEIMQCNYDIKVLPNGGLEEETIERLSLEFNFWVEHPIVIEYSDDIDLSRIKCEKTIVAAKNGMFLITFDKGNPIANEAEYNRLFKLYGKDMLSLSQIRF